jgi:hypothetical protein
MVYAGWSVKSPCHDSANSMKVILRAIHVRGLECREVWLAQAHHRPGHTEQCSHRPPSEEMGRLPMMRIFEWQHVLHGKHPPREHPRLQAPHHVSGIEIAVASVLDGATGENEVVPVSWWVTVEIAMRPVHQSSKTLAFQANCKARHWSTYGWEGRQSIRFHTSLVGDIARALPPKREDLGSARQCHRINVKSIDSVACTHKREDELPVRASDYARTEWFGVLALGNTKDASEEPVRSPPDAACLHTTPRFTRPADSLRRTISVTHSSAGMLCCHDLTASTRASGGSPAP